MTDATVTPSPSRVDPGFIEEILQPLVQFDTENPPGNELEAAKFTAAWLEKAGFTCSLSQSAPGRGNVIAVLEGERPGPTLLLNGHLDTQPIARDSGWTVDPIGGEIRGERIYGRGTGDMKSGVAAMMAAGAAFAKGGTDFAGRLVLLASADETSGGYLGVGAVLDELRVLKPDFAVVCEPTPLGIGLGARGCCWVKLAITGRPGQAGKAHTGINAIAVAGDMIVELGRDLPASFPNGRSKYLPEPSFNFGGIAGGIKPNVIAQHVELIIDRRVTVRETADEVLAAVKAVVEPVAARWNAKVEATVDLFVPACELEETSPLVAHCRDAFTAVTGDAIGLTGAGGFTDAHFFMHDLGVPALNFGPWLRTVHPSGSNSDIPDEFGLIPEIVDGARVYERLIGEILAR
ncbi:M20 family metallopeptidase [Acuticoccus sediminis]|nr:M20/M25/M40 family metallo-hydrolase [Acuticoccus sediminis]